MYKSQRYSGAESIEAEEEEGMVAVQDVTSRN